MLVFEGIDKAGKATQARLLSRRLKKEGYRCKILSFPVYTTPIGRELKLSLQGGRKYPLQVRFLLMSANRWEMKEKIEARSVDLLILNRYIHSNIAYGIASGLDRHWLESLDSGLPQPDLVVLLDISPMTSLKRKMEGRDVNERDLAYLNKVRKVYLDLAEEKSWFVIDAERSVEQVHQDVFELVYDAFKKRRMVNP